MEGKSNKKKTTIQFTEELNKINSDIEVLGEYINANTGISCRCLKCGYPWNEGEWTLDQATCCMVGNVQIVQGIGDIRRRVLRELYIQKIMTLRF